MGKDRFILKSQERIATLMYANVLVDSETGINYLYVNYGSSGGLTPLLDADGKPVISPIKSSTQDGYQK